MCVYDIIKDGEPLARCLWLGLRNAPQEATKTMQCHLHKI